MAPLTSGAQSPDSVPRIGYLVVSPLVDPPTAERQAFLDGLRELGYVIGRNILIEYRSAEWNRELLPDLAAELVDRKVDVIVAAPGAIEAARQATRTIPIVFTGGTDPVVSGLVASLARPGGNITGWTFRLPEMAGKRLALLKEVVPKLSGWPCSGVRATKERSKNGRKRRRPPASWVSRCSRWRSGIPRTYRSLSRR